MSTTFGYKLEQKNNPKRFENGNENSLLAFMKVKQKSFCENTLPNYEHVYWAPSIAELSTIMDIGVSIMYI